MVKHFPLPRRLVDRTGYVLAACEGRDVLHVGCADFASEGDWTEVLDSGRWLHGRIAAVARSVVGLDDAAPAVAALKARYGEGAFLLGSAEHLEEVDLSRFDVVVAGEILEHLANPGLFLEAVARGLRPGAELVVTTVNAFCLRRLLRVALGRESVHVDHVAYYSHRTLARLGERCGLRVLDQAAYLMSERRHRLPWAFERAVALLSPDLGEGIVARFGRT